MTDATAIPGLLESPAAESPIVTGASMNRHASNQSYGTPFPLIRACERFFRTPIVWDLAASEANTKANFFFSEQDNSLTKEWHNLTPDGLLWLNPPFANIEPWARKCAEESKFGARILLLTPASVGANWFAEHVHGNAYVLALNGRITFVGASDGYPKDCMISAFGLGITGFSPWKWNTK